MILITGAEGYVGREVARALTARGLAWRAASRRSGFDFRDPGSWGPALAGCSGVFLLRPPAIADVGQTLVPFVDVARGVGPIVFLSVAGAGSNPLIPHHTVERHLVTAGVAHTVLRPGFFAQNLASAYRQDLVDDDRLFVPAGDGRAAFIDVADVGDVAAAVFADPAAHAGAAYTLTGPEAIGFGALAAKLTEALGRPIRYEAASALGYARHLRARGMSWDQAAVQTVLHVGLRFGQAATVDPTLPGLLGKPARTVGRYIAENAALWRVGPPHGHGRES